MADYPLRTANRLLGTLVQLLPDLVFMLMLWQLRQLFRGYRHGLLFTFEQIRRYRQIGVLLCVSFLVELIQTPLLDTVLTMSGPRYMAPSPSARPISGYCWRDLLYWRWHW